MIALALALILGSVPDAPLGTARAVRACAPTGQAVALTGVVTFAPDRPMYFYIADATGGVRVKWAASAHELRAGQAVRVVGTVERGGFLPVVVARTVERAADAPPVAPRPFNLTRDEAEYLDAQWVETEAVVQRAWVAEPWLKLDVARGRGQAVVYVPLPFGADVRRAEALRGATVRFRGVWERTGDPRDPPRVLVQAVGDLVPVADPGAPAVPPVRTARALDEPNLDPLAARRAVRFEGVLTLNLGNNQFFLRDATGVAMALLAEPRRARPGDRVAVVGFPRGAGTSSPPRIDNALVADLGPHPAGAPLPEAVPGTTADAARGRYEGQVLALAGTVRAVGRVGNWHTLTVLDGDVTYTVAGPEPFAGAAVGCAIEATGAVTRQAGGFPPTAFVLFGYRVAVTAPPPPDPVPQWWTGRRVAYLSAGLVGLLLLTGASATVYRAQVRRTALENRRLEGHLQRAAKLETVGRIAGGVVHDFNNVLTVITGAAQVLNEEPDDPARTAALAADIRRAGEQGATLARQLLAVTKQRPVVPRPLDLNAAVADSAGTLVRLMGDRVAVRVVADPNLPPVLADPAPILQMVLNLAVNARDAMPEGGTFTLATGPAAPGFVRLTATDTGTGMTDEVKARAFEAGFTTKGEDRGTGLGLFIVRNVVEGLGGTIRLSTTSGRGTTFEIDLPAAPRP